MHPWSLSATARRAACSLTVGMVVTCPLLWHAVAGAPVYSTETRVTLVSDAVSSDLRRPPEGLIFVARLVSQRITPRDPTRTPSDSVSLVGEGVRQGYTVTVPNAGNQWVRRHDRAELRVQAVAASEAEVQQLASTATRRIEEVLVELQEPFALPARETIRTTYVLSSTPVVLEGRGRPSRAVLTALILGAGATMATAVACDRRRGRADSGPVFTPSPALASRDGPWLG